MSNSFPLTKAFRNILVVVKQTPYETYLQLKAQGKAPVALRWERLKNRYMVHRQCVDDVTAVLGQIGIKYSVIGREELHRGIIQDKDLLIAVGGDGTVLNTSSFVDDSIPILGINSDPTRPEEEGVTKLKDERRSKGALCAASATNLKDYLPQALYGQIPTTYRSRIQTLVRSTTTGVYFLFIFYCYKLLLHNYFACIYVETRLPPALNDILISHPIPAAVSRFRLSLCTGKVAPSFKPLPEYSEKISINVWSSGLWVCTSTGSTAAMHAAGGVVMNRKSEDLQYMVREHLSDGDSSLSYDDALERRKVGHGMVKESEMLNIRWNSQYGSIYVDGSHFRHDLELGDEINIDGHAPYLQIFETTD